MLKAVNKDPSTSELRKFGLAMLLGFGVLGGLLWWRGRPPHSWGYAGNGRHQLALALWGLGALLGVIGFTGKTLGRPVYVGWMSAARAIGKVMTTILLSIVFFVLLPFFAFVKLRDPLGKKLRPDGSYWTDHKPHEPTLERVRRPF
jgi:hypothetical protein